MPATLSGGERQRVALARALAVEPRLLLLDEPLSALDRGLRERLAGELHDILRAAGATAMLVTHDHEEAFAVADRMAVMREGRIVQAGTLEEVWSRPADGWTAAVPRLRDRAHRRRARPGCASWSHPATTWESVALRRSALRVDPAGPLTARVEEARVTPDQIRVQLDVDGAGSLPGVADPGSDVRVGARVRVSIDTSRIALVPSTTCRRRDPRMTPCEAARLCSNGDDRRGHGNAGLHHRPGGRAIPCAIPTASWARRGCGLPLLCLGAFVADILPRTLWRSRGKPGHFRIEAQAAHPRALDPRAHHARGRSG